jgi:hypothetical protein
MTLNIDMRLLVTKKGRGMDQKTSQSVSCEMLDIGGNWNTLSYTSIQSIQNMDYMSGE